MQHVEDPTTSSELMITSHFLIKLYVKILHQLSSDSISHYLSTDNGIFPVHNYLLDSGFESSDIFPRANQARDDTQTRYIMDIELEDRLFCLLKYAFDDKVKIIAGSSSLGTLVHLIP